MVGVITLNFGLLCFFLIEGIQLFALSTRAEFILFTLSFKSNESVFTLALLRLHATFCAYCFLSFFPVHSKRDRTLIVLWSRSGKVI